MRRTAIACAAAIMCGVASPALAAVTVTSAYFENSRSLSAADPGGSASHSDPLTPPYAVDAPGPVVNDYHSTESRTISASSGSALTATSAGALDVTFARSGGSVSQIDIVYAGSVSVTEALPRPSPGSAVANKVAILGELGGSPFAFNLDAPTQVTISGKIRGFEDPSRGYYNNIRIYKTDFSFEFTESGLDNNDATENTFSNNNGGLPLVAGSYRVEYQSEIRAEAYSNIHPRQTSASLQLTMTFAVPEPVAFTALATGALLLLRRK